MAAAKGWRSMMVPAILTSTLGYGIGSFIGMVRGVVVAAKAWPAVACPLHAVGCGTTMEGGWSEWPWRNSISNSFLRHYHPASLQGLGYGMLRTM
jgi:subtilisin family serine protease